MDEFVDEFADGGENCMASPGKSDWEIVASEPMSPALPSSNGLRQMEEASHEEQQTKRKRLGVGEEEFMILDNSGFDEYFAHGIVPLSASSMIEVEDGASCSSDAAGALHTHPSLQGGTPHDVKKQETLPNVPVTVASSELGAVVPHPTSMGRGNNEVLEFRDHPLLAKPEEETPHYQISVVDPGDGIEGILHESVKGNEVFVRESQRLHDSPTHREQELITGHIGQPSDILDSEHLDATSNNNIDQNDRRGYASLTFAWLQRQLGQWCAYIRRTKTICSVALAAALVGLLVLGQGLLRMHSQNQQLLTLLFAKEKQLLQLMHQLMQLKEALARRRQVPVIWSKISH